MKRNLDLVREILLEVEAQDAGQAKKYNFVDISQEKAKHVLLLVQAGLLERADNVNSTQAVKVELTWEGHDFVDAIQDNGVWDKTKEGAAKLGGTTLGVIKDLAVAYIKQEAAEKLGIEL